MRKNFAKEWNETTKKIKESGKTSKTKIGYDTSGRNGSGYSDPTAREAIRRYKK